MTAKILFDVGLFILIWMTQLIVYPSFTYYDKESLVRWHKKYTPRITIIVLPLMFGQLITHGVELLPEIEVLDLITFILILLAWLNTFLYAVPLHNKIQSSEEVMESAKKLVHVNAWRTACWSLVFLIDVFLVYSF